MRCKPGEMQGTRWGLLGLLLCLFFNPLASPGQAVQATPAQANSSTYQGSIVKQAPVPGVLPLPLDQAIRMGLQYNLGLVLSGVNAGMAGAQRLQQLQALLPTVNGSVKEAAQETINSIKDQMKPKGALAGLCQFSETEWKDGLERTIAPT